MPVPTETLWNQRKLNAIFLVSALVAAASTAWMLLADYNRPWRWTQRGYFNTLAALAHFEFLDYQTPESKERHSALKQAVAAAERQIAARGDDEKALLREQAANEGRLAAATMAFGNLNAQIQVTEFNYNEHLTLEGPKAPKTIAAAAQLENERRELATLAAAKSKLEDDQRSIRGRLRAFYAARDEARKQLAAFEKGMDDARTRDQLYGGKGSVLGVLPVRALLNIPGFDFVGPRGQPGRFEVRQVVLPDVRMELNFAESYATDRCITCHIGIDNADMTRDRFLEKLEGALRIVNSERVTRGEKPLEVKGPVAPSADEKGQPVHLAYGQMSDRQKDEYLRTLSDAVNTYLRSTGRSPLEYGHPLLAHPRLDLYVSPDSPHPMNKMGCTVCHEGNGQETDFVLASHSPADEAQEHEWEKKYYVRNAGIPATTLHVAHEFWERPMLLKQHTSASCVKCHSDTADLEHQEGEPLPEAEPIVKGRELYTSLGCINCHAVEGLNDSRQVGPDLSHVGSKLTTGFLHRWIEYPKDFRPSTRMPHAFRQENNLPSSRSDDDPDPLLRTEAEIQAITHYIEVFSKPYSPHAVPNGVRGDAKRGEELFTTIGCLACHANLDVKDPTDPQGRSMGENWIVADLAHSGVSRDAARQRYQEMTHNQRVEYAVANFTPERRRRTMTEVQAERAAAEAEGREPDAKRLYVSPELTRFAPELGGLGTKLAPDPNDGGQVERARRWLYDWLREPRHYSSYTKMPRMFRDNYYWNERDSAEQRRKNDQDMLDVTEYLLSLRHDTFKPDPIPMDDRHRAETQRLVRMLLAGQNTESVVAAILADEKLDPSDPYGMLSERVVKAVARSLGDGEAGVKAAAEIVARQDLIGRQMLFLGNKMISHYGCYACHKIAGFENATRPGTELTTWGRKLLAQLDFAFFSSGFRKDREAQPDLFGSLFPKGPEFEQLVASTGRNPAIHVAHTHASFAYHKLSNPRIWDRAKLKKPYDKLKMPNFFLSEYEVNALVTYLLSRQDPLVRDTVKIDYGTKPIGRVATGRHLVNELNCVGCHNIENSPSTIHQHYFKLDPASGQVVFDVTNAPPTLYGEGAKIQFPWLYGFLNNVEMLRPWLKVRMPSFYLDAEQTTTLIDYFAAASQTQAESLGKRLAAAHGWDQKLNTTSTWRRDWFTDPGINQAAAWLSRFALRQRMILPFDIDTSNAANADDAANVLKSGFEKVVTGAAFLRDLYAVRYPFPSMPAARHPDEHYERGKGLLLELKCLACHVAGNPFAEGTTLDIKAPNLALTHRRLRDDWVRKWLVNPQWIQPGTNMPQLFGDYISAFKDYPEKDRNEAEDRYGKSGREQINLLVDFLNELGARNDTVVQPPAPEPAAPATSDEPLSAEDMFGDDDKKPEGAKTGDSGTKPAEPPSEEDDFQP